MAASGRAGKPLHPTNLHVNRELYPLDTVQSRTPAPSGSSTGSTARSASDKEWEKKVSAMILLNLSKLFGTELRTLQDLSRYRRALAKKEVPLPA